MTIEDSYKNFIQQLKEIYDERESANIADWAFESITGIKRLKRLANKQHQLNHSTIQQLDNALQRLQAHAPVQYVLGEAWFYKMKLKVNEHVLIPRPETEELVEWIVGEIRNQKSGIRDQEPGVKSQEVSQNNPDVPAITILDIGTGSGCIAIALKKELPPAEIIAMDVSQDALMIAKRNAADQNVKIGFLPLDFLDEGSWSALASFDIIVSNPPYIPENEKNKLAKNVTAYEPHIALFVENDDPFIFYKKIAAFAEGHLKKKGKVFVEVHEDHANKVEDIFAGNFTTEMKKDIYGRDRMVKACR